MSSDFPDLLCALLMAPETAAPANLLFSVGQLGYKDFDKQCELGYCVMYRKPT